MARFDDCIQAVLEPEGGLVDDPADPAANSCRPDRLLLEVSLYVAARYRDIVERRHASESFLAGWLNRAHS